MYPQTSSIRYVSLAGPDVVPLQPAQNLLSKLLIGLQTGQPALGLLRGYPFRCTCREQQDHTAKGGSDEGLMHSTQDWELSLEAR